MSFSVGVAGFPRQNRLLVASDYRRVFKQRQALTSRHFVMQYALSGGTEPRLGLVMKKKVARRAIDRNKLKRCARESFRMNRQQLTGLDVVVIARHGAASHDKQALRQELDALWTQLSAYAVKASSA